MKKVLAFAVCFMTVFAMSVNCFAMDLVKNGSRGDDVREIQEMLISQGYLDGGADGIFGVKTETAVLAFQKDHGLDATGIVGEGTYAALKESDAEAVGEEADAAQEAADSAGEEADAAPAGEEADAAPAGEEADAAQDAAGEEADAAQEAATPEEGVDYAEVFPSWDPESDSLNELVEFVTACADESSPEYLEPADRIATFDMDGTILCEKAPVYFDYCLTMHRVLDDPSYPATEEELDSMQQVRDHAYSEGETFHPEGPTKHDLIASAFSGMTPEEFRAYVVDFADNTDVVGFEGMTYGESFYRPMLEVIDFLRANDFDVWMVSACEREVVRALVERLDIPFDHVIATDVPYYASGKEEDTAADDYNMSQDEVFLLGAPLDEVECGKSGKPAAIVREIGKRPVLAFGNSSGDYSMLNYAMGNPDHAGMGVFIVCDDTEREYGSEEKAEEYYGIAEKEGWNAVSMANDWAEIYGEGVQKTELPGVEEAVDLAA